MGVRIIDKTAGFLRAVEQANDRALAQAAADIERIAKQTAPHNKGQLVQSGRHERIARLFYRVIFNKEYASAQEAGQMTVHSTRRVKFSDGSWATLKPGVYKFRHYTEAGKKAHYLEDAGKQISKDMNKYLKRAGSLIRV